MGYPVFSVGRRKGVYLRVICGVRKAVMLRRRVIMLNLTTNSANVVGLSDDEKMESIGKAWNELHRILTNEYGDFEHYYLVTNEGCGVVHVVIVGLPFVYYGKLMRWWNYLYGSFCWISKLRGSAECIAGYLFGQYLSGQKATKVYGKMSDNWVCSKFMSYWRILRNCSRCFANGVYVNEWQRWYYPIDIEMLIANFKSWLRYFVITGRTLEYVPSRFDFKRICQTRQLSLY